MLLYICVSFFQYSIANTLQDYSGHVTMGLFQESISHITKNIYVEVQQTGWEISELPILKWFFRENENSTSSQPVISISIPITRSEMPRDDQGKSTEAVRSRHLRFRVRGY